MARDRVAATTVAAPNAAPRRSKQRPSAVDTSPTDTNSRPLKRAHGAAKASTPPPSSQLPSHPPTVCASTPSPSKRAPSTEGHGGAGGGNSRKASKAKKEHPAHAAAAAAAAGLALPPIAQMRAQAQPSTARGGGGLNTARTASTHPAAGSSSPAERVLPEKRSRTVTPPKGGHRRSETAAGGGGEGHSKRPSNAGAATPPPQPSPQRLRELNDESSSSLSRTSAPSSTSVPLPLHQQQQQQQHGTSSRRLSAQTSPGRNSIHQPAASPARLAALPPAVQPQAHPPLSKAAAVSRGSQLAPLPPASISKSTAAVVTSSSSPNPRKPGGRPAGKKKEETEDEDEEEEEEEGSSSGAEEETEETESEAVTPEEPALRRGSNPAKARQGRAEDARGGAGDLMSEEGDADGESAEAAAEDEDEEDDEEGEDEDEEGGAAMVDSGDESGSSAAGTSEEEDDSDDEEDEDEDDVDTDDEDDEDADEFDSEEEEESSSEEEEDDSDEEESEVAPRRARTSATAGKKAAKGKKKAGGASAAQKGKKGKKGKSRADKPRASARASADQVSSARKKSVIDTGEQIRTKVSREGDMNVKVIFAVRSRHCFRRYVKEVMTRFNFEKATDFDMYCIDPSGDRVDIDIEEDFEQLLDAFVENARVMASRRSTQFSPVGAGEGEETRASRSGSVAPPHPPPHVPHIKHPRTGSNNGTTAAGVTTFYPPSASNGNGTDELGCTDDIATSASTSTHSSSNRFASSNSLRTKRSGNQQHFAKMDGTNASFVGNSLMDDDEKSNTTVLRLYVRYSNAYYVEHVHMNPSSPSTPPPPTVGGTVSYYPSPSSPRNIPGVAIASAFANQLQLLSAIPSSPRNPSARLALDQPVPAIGASVSSPYARTWLTNTFGSADGLGGFSLQNSGGGGVGGSGRPLPDASLLSAAPLPPGCNDSVILNGLGDTQRSELGATFAVVEGELVDWRRMSVLGKGSFGTVYEGITLDGKMIAVKVQELPLDDDAVEVKALQLEINLMRSLKHRNIVAYYGCQTRLLPAGNQQMEIFLELCHGGSLATLRRKVMKTQQEFGISLVRSYTRQVLEGLAYLHAQHVIHRDIKCDNVLISATGEAKLADFGCSKRLGAGTLQANNSGSFGPAPGTHASEVAAAQASAKAAMYQTMVGSPFFMAPEVMREEEGGYTRAADIWSVGCLVIELLGREPWDIAGTNIFQIMFRLSKEQGMPTGVPADCPAALHSFFERCFQRDPTKRATAAELLNSEWITCSDKLLEEVPPPPPPPPPAAKAAK